MVVFAIFILFWFLLLAKTYRPKEFKKKYVLFSVLSIILYWGFSRINAVDIPAYMEFFSLISVNGWVLDSLSNTPAYNMEPALFLIMQFCKNISSSYYFSQFVIFFIYISLLYLGLFCLYRKHRVAVANLLMLSVCCQILLYTMRQGFGVSIVLLLSYLTLQKKRLYSLLLILVAIFFHQSSFLLLFIPILWLFYKKMPLDNNIVHKCLFMIFALCNICYFSGISLSTFVEENFGGWVYDTSFSTTRTLAVSGNVEGSNFGVLKILELDFCFVVFFLTDLVRKNETIKMLSGFMLLYFICNLLAGGMAIHRINYFLTIPYYLILFEAFRSVFMKYFKFDAFFSSASILVYLVVLYFIQSAGSETYIYEYHLLDLVL